MGLLSGVLPWAFSQGDRLKRHVGGLLNDPMGSVEQTAGLLMDKHRAHQELQAQAFSDPNRPFRLTNDKALGGMVDQMMAGPLGFAPVGMTAWHGSPHLFNKFDSSKIGTGEGAQAYGHGLYLAEAPDVAKTYAAISNAHDAAQASGNLYKVDLPDPAVARMLDWDKPLSQQPEVVRRAAEKLGITDAKNGDDLLWKIKRLQYGVRESHPSFPGGEAARFASERLRQEGVPGVRYLDGGSRSAGGGSSNFVVFPGEESILKILERNGQPLR